MRYLLGLVFGIFLLMFIGNILLTEFPSLVPLFEEGKTMVANLYNVSLVRYGAMATVLFIIGLLFVFGDSKKGR